MFDPVTILSLGGSAATMMVAGMGANHAIESSNRVQLAVATGAKKGAHANRFVIAFAFAAAVMIGTINIAYSDIGRASRGVYLGLLWMCAIIGYSVVCGILGCGLSTDDLRIRCAPSQYQPRPDAAAVAKWLDTNLQRPKVTKQKGYLYGESETQNSKLLSDKWQREIGNDGKDRHIEQVADWAKSFSRHGEYVKNKPGPCDQMQRAIDDKFGYWLGKHRESKFGRKEWCKRRCPD